MENVKLSTTRKALWLAIFLFTFTTTFAQEIPNGDNDVLWERSLNGRTVNDAKFHPINGNIIAAVNHEIWEIDPKDGHTIRVFEGGYPADEKDEIRTINITSDGQKVITGGAMGQKGILIWDYNTGLVTKIISLNEIFDVYENIGIYPDDNRIIFNTYQNNYGSLSNKIHINIYNLQLDSLVKQTSIADTYCDRFRLSKDGTKLALGYGQGNPKDGWSNSMELWDTETLTKIKDFGSPGDINEFSDVQISDDNKYVGFVTNGSGWLLKLFNCEFGNLLKQFNYAVDFGFSNNSKHILFSSTPEAFKTTTNIVKLTDLDTVYQYFNAFGIFKINKQNEILTYGFDTLNGLKLKLLSNRWYFVGVTNPIEIQCKITLTKYTNNSILIFTEGIEIINTLLVTDTLGKKIYVQNEIPVLNNQTKIPLFLPSGNYLLKIISNGKEYTSKFIVVR